MNRLVFAVSALAVSASLAISSFSALTVYRSDRRAYDLERRLDLLVVRLNLLDQTLESRVRDFLRGGRDDLEAAAHAIDLLSAYRRENLKARDGKGEK